MIPSPHGIIISISRWVSVVLLILNSDSFFQHRLLLLSRAVFPFFNIPFFILPRPILTDGYEVDVTTGRHQCRRKLLALWERSKGKRVEHCYDESRVGDLTHVTNFVFVSSRKELLRSHAIGILNCSQQRVPLPYLVSQQKRYNVGCTRQSTDAGAIYRAVLLMASLVLYSSTETMAQI